MNPQNDRLEKLSNYFLINLFLIILFGLIMVYSSSYMYAKENFGSAYHFVAKQLVYLILGCFVAWGFSKLRILFLYRYSYTIHAIGCFILTLTLIPGLGVIIKGSRRWLNLGFMQIQPGEFIKFTIMLAALRFFENFQNYSAKERVIYFSGIMYPLMIFLIQPDFGTFAIASMIIAFFAYLSTFPRKYFYSCIALGGVAALGLLFAAPYRVKRVLAFMDPWQDPRGSGFQIIQSFLAFANGSFAGQGLGNSNEKLFYLPEAYNDFIFSVVGEELGFIGVILTVALFISLIFIGLKISTSVKSRVGSILIAGSIFGIGLQAFLNMGVVLGLLPTKGLNLPFISYGGSSLLANMAAIGLILACLKIKVEDRQVRVNSKEALKPKKLFKNIFQA